MAVPIRAGLLLGVLVVFWTFVMGFTGWYKDPAMVPVFFLVIVFEIAVVIWALRQTARDSSWALQIFNGLVLSLVASVIIFAGSLVFTTMVFPSYFADIRAAHLQMLQAQGVSEAEIKTQMEAAAAMQTPVMNALSGVIGTIVTGVVVAAIAGIVWRKK